MDQTICIYIVLLEQLTIKHFLICCLHQYHETIFTNDIDFIWVHDYIKEIESIYDLAVSNIYLLHER